MRKLAPDLLAIPGCSAIGAAHLIGQTAGAARFGTDAAFAMHVGVAPLPVSSGKSDRHRLNRCGNRKLNSTIHMIAVTQARMHPPAIAYMERKTGRGDELPRGAPVPEAASRSRRLQDDATGRAASGRDGDPGIVSERSGRDRGVELT